MKLKGVLFDLDGTLINSNELIYETFDYTLQKVLHTSVPHPVIAKTFGRPLVDVMPEFSQERAQELFDTFIAYSQKRHAEGYIPPAFPNVRETIEALHGKGVKIALVTSKKRFAAERELKQLGVYEWFDFLVTPESTEIHKPDPAPALYAMQKLSLDPHHTVMVGDSRYDMLCGKHAGCKTALVSYTEMASEDFIDCMPDYRLQTIGDLLQYV